MRIYVVYGIKSGSLEDLEIFLDQKLAWKFRAKIERKYGWDTDSSSDVEIHELGKFEKAMKKKIIAKTLMGVDRGNEKGYPKKSPFS